MEDEKNYISGMFIKEKTFENGGSQLRIGIKISDFIEQLRQIQDDGWANMIVARRKKPSDTGITHYLYEDTWKPNKNFANSNQDKEKDQDDLPW
jgi:hypothetical protein